GIECYFGEPAPLAQSLQCNIHRHPVEPRRDARVAAEARDRAEHLDEHLLNDVLEVVAARAEDAIEGARNLGAIGAVEAGQGVALAAAAPLDERERFRRLYFEPREGAGIRHDTLVYDSPANVHPRLSPSGSSRVGFRP